MNIGLNVEYPLFLSDFNETWIFSTVFRKILKYRISQQSVLWGSISSTRTDGRTDMTKIIVAFHNFVKELKNIVIFYNNCSGHLSFVGGNYWSNLVAFGRTSRRAHII